MVKSLNGRVEYVPIVLKNEWMGHPKKTKLTIIKSAADALITRGVARLDKKQVKKKGVEKPVVDKMVRKKSVRTK